MFSRVVGNVGGSGEDDRLDGDGNGRSGQESS